MTVRNCMPMRRCNPSWAATRPRRRGSWPPGATAPETAWAARRGTARHDTSHAETLPSGAAACCPADARRQDALLAVSTARLLSRQDGRCGICGEHGSSGGLTFWRRRSQYAARDGSSGDAPPWTRVCRTAHPRPATPVPPGLGTLVPAGRPKGDHGGPPGAPRPASRRERYPDPPGTRHLPAAAVRVAEGRWRRIAAKHLNRPCGLLGPWCAGTCMPGPEGAPVQQCTGATRPGEHAALAGGEAGVGERPGPVGPGRVKAGRDDVQVHEDGRELLGEAAVGPGHLDQDGARVECPGRGRRRSRPAWAPRFGSAARRRCRKRERAPRRRRARLGRVSGLPSQRCGSAWAGGARSLRSGLPGIPGKRNGPSRADGQQSGRARCLLR